MGVLMVLGILVSIVGGIMLLVVAFRESIWWGLGSFFVPFVSLIFVITHWEDSKRAFFISLAGTALFLGAGLMMPKSTPPAVPAAAEPVEFHPRPEPPAPIAPAAAETPQAATQTYEAEPEPEFNIKIEKVWADNSSQLYYSAKCKKRPENAYPIAKSVAVRQGFRPAPCN